MSRNGKRGGLVRRHPPDLNVIPLIDVMIFLVIYLVTSTTFTKDMQIDIDRPGAASAETAGTKSLRISIDVEGQVFVDGTPTKPWMLQSRVRDFIDSGGSSQVLVVSDRLLPVDRLVEVVDQCRLAGASEVGVATLKETGE